MPLTSFSIPEQRAKLLDGRKRQTTRLARVNPINVGDVLYCYYKSRMKKSCKNCLTYLKRQKSESYSMCPNLLNDNLTCCDWNNYFGEAEVVHVRPFSLYQGLLDKWAIADGFESLDEAMKWLDKTHKGWMDKINDFDVIIFEPRWTPSHEAKNGN